MGSSPDTHSSGSLLVLSVGSVLGLRILKLLYRSEKPRCSRDVPSHVSLIRESARSVPVAPLFSLLVEEEGFETDGRRRPAITPKTDTVPPALVRRFWRKMHSPAPVAGI